MTLRVGQRRRTNDELQGLALGVALDFGDRRRLVLIAHHLRYQVRRFEERQRRPFDPLDREAGAQKHLIETLGRKEPHVALVEQPELLIVEATGKHREADRAVRDIRDRGNDVAALRERSARLIEQSQRIVQVF